MSKLRIREELLRAPKEMLMENRKELEDTLRGVLADEKCVVLAVLHGGFASNRVFRDVDVAVLLDKHLDKCRDELAYIEELRDKLEKVIGIGVDIQVLNSAPPSFTYHTLTTGRILIERVSGISAILRVHTLEEMKKLNRVKEFLKELHAQNY